MAAALAAALAAAAVLPAAAAALATAARGAAVPGAGCRGGRACDERGSEVERVCCGMTAGGDGEGSLRRGVGGYTGIERSGGVLRGESACRAVYQRKVIGKGERGVSSVCVCMGFCRVSCVVGERMVVR